MVDDNAKLRSIHDVLTEREDGSDPANLNGKSQYIAHNRRTPTPAGGTNTISINARKFFYDAQIARLLIQLGTKVFGGYQVISGFQTDGKIRMKDVPVMFGGQSRVVAQLFNGLSDNVVVSLPIMSYTVTNITRKVSEVRNPQQTQQFVVRYRARDPDGNLLVNQPGKYIVVERLMPVPFEMDLELHIWSSNTDQLFQMVEQLCAVFNPDLELAISDSPLDWTSPTRILFKGGVQFNEVTPAQNPDPTQIAVMNFSTTIRLALPVRVYDASLIHEIDVNIRELEDFAFYYFGENLEIANMPLLDRLIIQATPQEIVDHNNQ